MENKSNSIDIGSFYTFFKSIFQTGSEKPPICSEENQPIYFQFDNQNESLVSLNSDITVDEVENSLKGINSNRSPGLDGIIFCN